MLNLIKKELKQIKIKFKKNIKKISAKFLAFCEEKITKIKMQMNEYEIYFHVNINSQRQILHSEFTNWK